ncbi:crotonase/enoyl-CoA hydratase family protein [Sphingomonas gei]|uniref:Crotonase/enoyl-CoA hydratase family protein n=1 Tax=Sphingomonas gei TaxID=1395960 RepID=A0A4S1X273_9SPHN|nr:crotonase/enoyl-CoA hydratase family protein [Sphingomonas gei]TGX49087.1 crotonase/enoyl-CoA hydratase family protein [Sphingomonas gei]
MTVRCERVRTDVAGGIATVTLARPAKLNALDMEMFEALARVASALAESADVRAVVLSGEGRAFCAGIDLDVLQALPREENRKLLATRSHGASNIFQHAAMAWRTLPMPVIAALHGSVFGAGLQIALGADMRVAAPTARLSVMELKWGLVPDMGGIALLRGLLRDDVVRRLVYTGRIISSEEALAIGLVTQLDEDPLRAATAVAKDITKQSPQAVRAAKRLMNAMADGRTADLLRQEAEEQLGLLGRAENLEAIAANFEGRAPAFADLPSRS